MGTMTAQMIIGSAHPYDGGIIPDYYMYLSENGVARWTIMEDNIKSELLTSKHQPLAQWIPTIEYMLEDAFLMIGIYVIKDQELVQMVQQFYKGKVPRNASLYEDIPPKALELMRKRARTMGFPCKLTISVFNGSSLMQQIQVLENYSMDVEVCVPVYLREYIVWNSTQGHRGTLMGSFILENKS